MTSYDDLKAIFIDGSPSRSPGISNTEGLIAISAGIMERQGVDVEVLRSIDHDIAVGVYPDMTEHGATVDEWPSIYERAPASDILVLCGPIWLGDNSSETKKVIERLHACSHLLNSAGQCGRVGRCLITGNEDGSGTAR